MTTKWRKFKLNHLNFGSVIDLILLGQRFMFLLLHRKVRPSGTKQKTFKCGAKTKDGALHFRFLKYSRFAATLNKGIRISLGDSRPDMQIRWWVGGPCQSSGCNLKPPCKGQRMIRGLSAQIDFIAK